MATSRIEIGNKAVSIKSGKIATITAIITKSTGYIRLIGENGVSFTDMAANYNGVDGLPLKAKKAAASEKSINNAVNSFAAKLAESEYNEHKF